MSWFCENREDAEAVPDFKTGKLCYTSQTLANQGRLDMRSSGEVKAVEVRSPSDIDFVFPNGFSFFEPYLQYFIRETIGAGGEAYVSRTSEGNISGLFVYDGSEKTGTIYTRSKEAFDYVYELRPANFLFAELKTEHESEVYDIYTIDLENLSVVHRFIYEISIAEEGDVDEIGQVMSSINLMLNRRRVNVAFYNGVSCL